MSYRSRKIKVTRLVLTLVLALVILINGNTSIAYADVPYETYNYNYWGEDVRQPHAYLYSDTLDSREFGTSLSYPQDMYFYNEEFYIADTNNSRVLKLSRKGEVQIELTAADGGDDKLKKPQGVFVTAEGTIYVADTDNSRIIEYSSKGEFIRQIGRPDTDLISSTQEYKPTKVVVDHNGSIYVIAYGINLGLLVFEANGDFQGFIGATKVKIGAFEYIWKNYFSTDAQKARMQTFIPTEYNNIFVDQDNFIYATIGNLSDEDYMNGADAIRRLNPMGKDILRRQGEWPIIGDFYTGYSTARSVFVDAFSAEYGSYFVLDSTGGKIFAYDYDGNNMFSFGNKGSQEGMLQNPVALALSAGQKNIYVLDKDRGSILIYDITEYGEHLLGAVKSNYMGNSETSVKEWEEVLKANANSELAYIGLGKNYLLNGEYKKAMDYFKLGNNRKYFSKAFYYYRKTLMEQNFAKIMEGIILIAGTVLIVRRIRKIKRWVGEVRCIMSKH